MKIPDDVDEIILEVEAAQQIWLRQSYELDSRRLPTTLAVASDGPARGPVRVRLLAQQAGRARTLREVITTIPEERNALLRMPIEWLCDGTAESVGPARAETTCPDGQTCVMGRCVEAEVEEDKLEDYSDGAVFGGGIGRDDGACLDTVPCFSMGRGVPVRHEDCSIEQPDGGEGTNVALVLPLGSTDGICGPDVCLIPLDEDDGRFPYRTGFLASGDRLTLPEAVCDKLDGGELLSVAVTTACATKTPAIPPCGPWSAVQNPPGSFDAPAPADLPDPNRCDEPTDSEAMALCFVPRPEAVAVVEDDLTLDGFGTLVVEVFDTPEVLGVEPLERFVSAEEVAVDALPTVPFDDLGAATVYVRAALFDNPDETTFDSLQRGGGWLGVAGRDRPGDTGVLEAVTLEAGVSTKIAVRMQALRRLNVTLSLANPGSASDGGDGYASWSAFASTTVTAADDPVGSSARTCLDLGAGPAVLTGYVLGAGPHFLVASLDDYGLGAPGQTPWTVPGAVLSGGPGEDQSWGIADQVSLAGDAYVASASLAVDYALDVGEPPPASFSCPSGLCGDGMKDGTETDVDCGGECLACAAGGSCAGDGDCRSRVCAQGTCQAATCEDQTQNGNETDVDCGGECDPCLAGEGCLGGGDCVSGSCIDAVCQ